jgi:hypothetical protein
MRPKGFLRFFSEPRFLDKSREASLSKAARRLKCRILGKVLRWLRWWLAWQEFGVLEETASGYSHGASDNLIRPSRGGFMVPAVRPSTNSILVPINAPSFVEQMVVVRLKHLIRFNTGRCSSHAQPQVFRPYIRYTLGRK